MTSLQIRNMPDELHRQLKARAALAGQSLSEFAMAELRRSVERPTRRQLIERVQQFERVEVATSSAEAVRATRDNR